MTWNVRKSLPLLVALGLGSSNVLESVIVIDNFRQPEPGISWGNLTTGVGDSQSADVSITTSLDLISDPDSEILGGSRTLEINVLGVVNTSDAASGFIGDTTPPLTPAGAFIPGGIQPADTPIFALESNSKSEFEHPAFPPTATLLRYNLTSPENLAGAGGLIRFHFHQVQVPLDEKMKMTLTISSSNGGSAVVSMLVPDSGLPQEVDFLYSDFIGVDFSQVTEVEALFNGMEMDDGGGGTEIVSSKIDVDFSLTRIEAVFTTVPEPGTYAMLGASLACLAWARSKRLRHTL